MPIDWQVTATSSPQLANRLARRERERRIAALATRQHGVLTLPQLVALGLSTRTVGNRLEDGRLHLLHRGVYALGRPDLPPEGRWMAAVLACGDGTLLSHRSAAALHGLLGVPSGRIDVTITRDLSLSRPGICPHRSTRLAPSDCTIVNGVPCTAVGRTLIDVAAVVPHGVLEGAFAKAEISDPLISESMGEQLARNRGRPGVRPLRTLVERGAAGEGVARTALERRFLALCKRGRVPRPSVNQWVAIPGEEMECDFVWSDRRVVVEVDGFQTHRTHRAFQEDRRRDRVLRLDGWAVVRFTWHDVTRDAPRVLEVVREMLRPVS